MPSIFTPIPSEIERKAPGTGGKPQSIVGLQGAAGGAATMNGKIRIAVPERLCTAPAPLSSVSSPPT